ncbi:hypothetical protein E4U57_005373 [Claviceps arundinis]|uniref:Clr5 domain-containing protein n=1 Tax=Claviceps arundinis TaxID=1623583 RepID=A0ABQ7P3K2_9HYPO|nr:hypothetical protein E4U57_005373 [Claviceps arundinis]
MQVRFRELHASSVFSSERTEAIVSLHPATRNSPPLATDSNVTEVATRAAMVYEWDEHQQTCHRLYVEEGKSLKEIRDHMKTVYKFTPSERAFQSQFRRWNFPLKQRSVPDADRIERRVKELWEKNYSQRDMLRTLREEKFDVRPRELVRLRLRNNWLLRPSRKERPKSSEDESPSAEGPQISVIEIDRNSPFCHAQQDLVRDEAHEKAHEEATLSQRQQKRKASRAVGQDGKIVRFPSETTLDEAQQILCLTPSTYRDLRSNFQQICEEEGIIKKTDAGAVKWECAKERLIRQMPELQVIAWDVSDQMKSRQVALDVICTDVTKRMRIMGAKMTLAEAKNILGINPEQFREIRFAFFQSLDEVGVRGRMNATPEQWESVKRAWGCKSALLQQILTNMKPDQVRAFDVLTRTILKKRQDAQRLDALKSSREQPQRQQREPNQAQSPELQSPEPQAQQSQSQRPQTRQPPRSLELPPRLELPQTMPRNQPARISHQRILRNNYLDAGDGTTGSDLNSMSEETRIPQIAFNPSNSTMGAQPPVSTELQTPGVPPLQDGVARSSCAHKLSSTSDTNVPLDPQLEQSMLLRPGGRTDSMNQAHVQSRFTPEASPTPLYPQIQPAPTVCAIYMRLHPSSSVFGSDFNNLWVATLGSRSVQELRQIAEGKFPGTHCARIEAIIKDGKGGEIPLYIGNDPELGAYIAHLNGNEAAPTFNVQMVWKAS